MDVKIVELKPTCVVSFHAMSESPEEDVIKKLTDWAEPKGYLKTPRKHKILGFDTPIPKEGDKIRGYEIWMTIDKKERVGGDIKMKDFPGGLYAATTLKNISDPWKQIPSGWKKLGEWVKENGYECGEHQCLEEHLPPSESLPGTFSLILYHPIMK